MRRLPCGSTAALLAFVVLTGLAGKRNVSDQEVQSVHRSALLIDTHNDVTGFTVDGFDIGNSGSKHHTDLARLKAGGVGAVFFAAYVGPEYAGSRTSAIRALQMIDTIRTDIVGRYPNDFVLARSADEIEAAHKRGRIAALIGIEGGHAIEDSLRLLRDFYALGVRYMTLTHTNTNGWADSSGDMDKPGIKHHNGLTDFGKQVIVEMNRLGMIVDVSHVSDKTFWDALKTSHAPIFASHSSCRAICNVARNMTDEMIVAMAKKGGVIQINFYSAFLSQKSADIDRLAEAAKSGKDRPALPPAVLEDAVAHINHVVKIAGIDAVGIGSDFDGVKSVPTGLEDVSKFPNLTRALLEEGYSAVRYPEDLWREYAAVDASGGEGCSRAKERTVSVKPEGGSRCPQRRLSLTYERVLSLRRTGAPTFSADLRVELYFISFVLDLFRPHGTFKQVLRLATSRKSIKGPAIFRTQSRRPPEIGGLRYIESPKRIPSREGWLAQRQESRSQTGWVIASKLQPTPGPDGPYPSQEGIHVLSKIELRTDLNHSGRQTLNATADHAVGG